MFYPARWKKITVDQNKVLKNRLFRFFWGHPVYKVLRLCEGLRTLHDSAVVRLCISRSVVRADTAHYMSYTSRARSSASRTLSYATGACSLYFTQRGRTTLRLKSSNASRHHTLHKQNAKLRDWRMRTLLFGIANARSWFTTSREDSTCQILTTRPTSQSRDWKHCAHGDVTYVSQYQSWSRATASCVVFGGSSTILQVSQIFFFIYLFFYKSFLTSVEYL